MTKCPDCQGEIKVSDGAAVGEIVSCPDCGLELEIKQIDLDGVDLRVLSIEKEDWGE